MTLTATSTFTVANAGTLSAVLAPTIGPPVGVGTGFGRLVHPILGTLDYYKQPDHVSNMDGDAIYGPIWTHSNTLGGGVDAVWNGFIGDVICTEMWSDKALVFLPHVQLLAYFWMNPPDPSTGSYVLWYPNYRNGHCFQVAMIDLKVGGKEYTYDTILAYQNYVEVPLELQLRLIGKVS